MHICIFVIVSWLCIAQPYLKKEKKLKLGARIRKIRMFRNITQKELGRRLGYGENSADVRIAQYERGQRTPKQETLIRIAEILEVDVRNFLSPGIATLDELMEDVYKRQDWFSDDLKKLDDENVYRKMQGHWIIEMSEMIATANAKSIEEIKAFLSRQKETYKIPYETPVSYTHLDVYKRQGIDSDRQETSEFAPFLNIMNEWFVRDTSKKIKAVLKSRGSSGNAHAFFPSWRHWKD